MSVRPSVCPLLGGQRRQAAYFVYIYELSNLSVSGICCVLGTEFQKLEKALTQEGSPSLLLLGFEDVAEDVIADVKNVFPASPDHVGEGLAIPSRVDLTLPKGAHVLANLELARVSIDSASDRVLAEETGLSSVNDHVVEERNPMTPWGEEGGEARMSEEGREVEER